MKMTKIINKMLILTSLCVISTSTLYAGTEVKRMEAYGNKVFMHYPRLDIGSDVAYELAYTDRIMDATQCFKYKECPNASVPDQRDDWNGLTMDEMSNANEIIFSVPDDSYKIGYLM